MSQLAPTSSPISRLQRLAKPRAVQEHCELCGCNIAPEHVHLLDVNSRQLMCACEACGILFSGHENQRYRRVPRRVQLLRDLEGAGELLESLSIPINLAFLYRSTPLGKVVAMYPSPAGATESQLPMDAWDDLATKSPALQGMQSDVEALLFNHVRGTSASSVEPRRDCFLVSIDECYKLVGLIRSQWRGLSGGSELWKAMDRFFDELNRRAEKRGASHA